RGGRPRALREAPRDDPRGCRGDGGRRPPSETRGHDGLQLALRRLDAGAPRAREGGFRGPRLPPRVALARLALGRRDRRGDVADGPRPGGPRRYGRHGRPPRGPRPLDLRRIPARGGAHGHRVRLTLGARRQPAAGRRGLLHRARRASLRRAGHADREPRHARGERAHAGGVRLTRRRELSPEPRKRALVGGRAAPGLGRRPRARRAPHRRPVAEERRRVVEAVVKNVAGRVPVVVGVGAPGTHLAAAFARMAREHGADAVMVAPPNGVKNLEAVAEYFHAVAEAARVPIVIQDEPVTTQAVMPAPFIARLCTELPQAPAVKLEEAPTLPKITRLRAALARPVAIFGGLGGVYFFEELSRGADGA